VTGCIRDRRSGFDTGQVFAALLFTKSITDLGHICSPIRLEVVIIFAGSKGDQSLKMDTAGPAGAIYLFLFICGLFNVSVNTSDKTNNIMIERLKPKLI
jgi:hypothetical protein